MSASNQATKWADGLRGIASLLVVTAHICRSLIPYLLNPAVSEHGRPLFMQLPFVRNLFMGRASVAVFSILAGYVNGLKPIKQTRAGQIDAALSGIAKSAFRRTGRFIIPAMVATTISWLVCQFNGYGLAKVVASAWIRDTSPWPSDSFPGAFIDLFDNLMSTWTTGSNEYDKIQWTLCYLLRGSMLVYLGLFATAYVQPKYRIIFFGVLYGYYWRMGDAVIGINVFFGLIMAEISYDQDVQRFVERRPLTVSIASAMSIILGLFLISYPEENPHWAKWSHAMTIAAGYMFPRGSETARFYPGFGADLFCMGILFNSTAKRLLSHPHLCWIGKMSFAVYLIHAPLLRTVLTYMLYGLSSRPPWPGKDKDGHDLPWPWVPLTSPWITLFAIPLFYVLLYRLASLWVAYVDPWCGRVTNWVEQKVFRDEGRGEKILLA